MIGKTLFDITIDLKKSHGSYVHDKKSGKEFLDFFSHYSSLPLGYNHPIFDEGFYQKLAEVAHMRMANNVFHTDELIHFTNHFRNYVFSDYIHYCCTGALAIESAIKCAMEYKKTKNPLVFGIKNSFHGVNSWGFITDRCMVTAERMKHFPQNNWANLTIEEIFNFIEKKQTDKLVAVVVEPVQCTAGDHYLNEGDLKHLQHLCNKNDICFIIDEIQTGFGVTGKMWYYEHLGLDPDILVFGKKSQICGLVAKEKYSECMTTKYQKLDVTFDGELIDAIRADYILKAYEKFNLLEQALKNNSYITGILKDKVLNYRSCGHLIAFDFATSGQRDHFVKTSFQNIFLCNPTGEKSVRLRPQMAISQDELLLFKKIINEVLSSS